MAAGNAVQRKARQREDSLTCVVHVGPYATSDVLKKLTQKGLIALSAGCETPPSLPLDMSPVRRRERTVKRLRAPILIARIPAVAARALGYEVFERPASTAAMIVELERRCDVALFFTENSLLINPSPPLLPIPPAIPNHPQPSLAIPREAYVCQHMQAYAILTRAGDDVTP